MNAKLIQRKSDCIFLGGYLGDSNRFKKVFLIKKPKKGPFGSGKNTIGSPKRIDQPKDEPQLPSQFHTIIQYILQTVFSSSQISSLNCLLLLLISSHSITNTTDKLFLFTYGLISFYYS